MNIHKISEVSGFLYSCRGSTPILLYTAVGKLILEKFPTDWGETLEEKHQNWFCGLLLFRENENMLKLREMIFCAHVLDLCYQQGQGCYLEQYQGRQDYKREEGNADKEA